MPKRKDIKLDAYNIGRYAYREMLFFCLQYNDKKRELACLLHPYSSPTITDMPHSNSIGDPTGKNAVKAATLSKDIEMIEQSAIEACPEEYEYLLTAVTNEDVKWHYLRFKGMKMNEKEFAKRRRIFFFLLAKRKNIL